jgi:hypothetical protein
MTPATSCRAAREDRRWAELFEAIWRCELALESIRQLLAQHFADRDRRELAELELKIAARQKEPAK